MKKHRILWQSNAVISNLPDYKAAILRHGEKVLGPDFQLDVRGVAKEAAGGTSIEFMAYEFLNNINFFDSVTKSAREGFDAIAIGCSLDPTLDELREMMQVPVLGLTETGMLTACMLGRRFSIISYNRQMVNKRFRELVHKYGLTERCAGLFSFDLTFEELYKGFRDPAKVIEKFTAAAIEAINKGAEIILPGCGALNMVLAENRISQIERATVLDVSGTLMKMTELMIVLREVSGTQISRRSFYERPPRENPLAGL